MENHNYRRSKRRMFRLLAKYLVLGIGTGWLILTAFFILDVGSLRTLAHMNHIEYIVYPLLYLFFAITFGAVSMGIGVMTMHKRDDDDDDFPGGGKKLPVIHYRELAKVKVSAQ